MKKYYFALVLTLFILPIFAQNIPSYVPKDGLVGWWPFNGNANDESGNGNNGVVNDAMLTEDREGKANAAYYFNGQNDIKINLSNAPTSMTTISCWIKSEEIENSTILSFYNNTTQYGKNQLLINVDKTISLNDNVGDWGKILSGTKINTNEWQHLVIRTTLQNFEHHSAFFINGKLVFKYDPTNNQFSNTYGQPFFDNVLGKILNIGGKTNNTINYAGKIDDILLYNRFLTDEEIAGLYEKGAVLPSYLSQNGLVAWYPFNGNANDESGNKNHGTVHGATLTKDRNGEPNKAYNFKDDTIQANLKNFLSNNNSPFAINTWFKSVQPAGIENQTLYYNNYGNNTIKARIYGKGYVQVYYGDYNSNSFISVQDKNYLDSNWYFLSVVYSGDTLKAYINGELKDMRTNIKIDVLDSTIYIGNPFLGAIDDISIYNRSLTDTEIITMFAAKDVTCSTPKATTSISDKTKLCAGESSYLSVNSSSYNSYQWLKDGQTLNNETKQNLMVNTAGIYTVKVTNGSCDTTINFPAITINPLPVFDIIAEGNTTFCAGGNVWLSASSGNTFAWSTGSDEKRINVSATGTYTLQLMDANGCWASQSIRVKVNPLPSISIYNIIVNDQHGLPSIMYKLDEPLNLVAYPSGGKLTVEGVETTTFNPKNGTLGAKKIKYSYTSAENCSAEKTFKITIVDTTASLCTETKYDTIQVTKYDTVTFTNTITKYDTITVKTNVYDTITITNTVTKYDTLTVKNNVYDTITITKYDTITIQNTITDTVSILKFNLKLTTGIKENQVTQLAVYPNPTSDVLIIETTDLAALQGYRISLVDLAGKEIQNIPFTAVKTELDVKKTLAKGMYVLHILDANNVRIQTTQIVIE
jgi:hypothetical protein